MNQINAKLQYVMERLQEPGSLRSLVLALFLIKGQVVDNVSLDAVVNSVLVVLAVVSFLMRGDAPKSVSPPAEKSE